VHGNDDVAALAGSYNEMLAALERSLGAQRQLVADASHELRTPITSIRTNSELLTGPVPLPDDDADRAIADIEEQSRELSALVEELLDLARATEPAGAAAPVDLDRIVEDAVERARPRAGNVDLDLASEPTRIVGTPGPLARAVANLLDNAIKWSPPGGRVQVRLARGLLSVADEGPGVAEADLPHVFERFYRAPDAREMPGSGLGLAIVKKVAEEHSGEVAISSPAGGGTLVTMRLPRIADQAEAAAVTMPQPSTR
jgi:two-component system sensor histidine kinase MprB